ncbi:TPR-like protein [Pluteus cervinus]|uniref:TPR-like protein n=1 Tax=Pluteus cervinus TaxID=181527 RepID=A0ACD3AS90_9AGAR|nr:TPR-like protein [Pluteus cervinus]
MSFQSLVSGSECAAPANPLSQVLKHTEGDRSLQQDRVAGPSSSRLHHLAGSAQHGANEQDLALAHQFFSGAPVAGPLHGPLFPGGVPITMNPNMVTSESQNWTVEQPQLQGADPVNWSHEFKAGPVLPSQLPTSVQPASSSLTSFNYTARPSFVGPMAGFRVPLSVGSYPQNYYAPPAGLQDKGKGKAKEVDFEAAFAQVAESFPASSTVETSDTADVAKITESLESAKLETDFASTWSRLQQSELPPPKEDLARWEAEFNQLMSAQREDLEHDHDYGASMQAQWESGLGDLQQGSTLKFDPDGLPVLEPYAFELGNKYLESPPNSSLLESAKALLENNGSLSEAALLLEAAIQRGELGEGNYEAWILLGETRNMDEREEAGMRALAEGVRKAEEAGTPGPGMLSLAISYTNESYDRASHMMLLRWLRARFPSHPIPDETWHAVRNNSTWDAHDRITEVFLNLARSQHHEGVMDADVQIALGVLFYSNSEYDRAKDCFESALSARPQDYLLWNRLGSSLSNGSKPEEALDAYREALQLRPTYTRAIYNVGVACLNIGAHKEAAEHFLSALGMQEASTGDTSDQLWITLRRAFLSLDRPDLAELSKSELKTNLEVFRREGFDF